jgi:sugar phosphate isomerase/epimerase
MKLGVAGLLGDGSAEAARRVREMGFTAASWHLPDAAVALDERRLYAVRESLEAEGLELCQLLPPAYPSLVHPDPEVREAGLALLRTTLRAARILKAGNLYIRPGSLNPAGAWTPHPDNHARQTRDRLIESLKRLVADAEEHGVPLSLEGHVVSPLHTPAVMREVLQGVASPWLRVNADPVNMVNSLDTAFHTAPLVNELFDLLGDAVITAHVKDVTVGDALVVHVEECVPGQGYMDHETFLRRFAECCPHGAVLIEHLPPDRVPEARRAMLHFAERAGLEFEKG